MKNQYFGDINDYKKYGLLRILSNEAAIKIGVCWMLTDVDKKNDGKFIDYLNKPAQWRIFDPPLFDSLKNCFTKPQNRNILLAQTSNIIPSAVFYNNLLSDNSLERQHYFNQFLSDAAACQLIFFDPDNGLETKSKPYGKKGSHKYLYWHEILSTFKAGHSILFYQHFPRTKRAEFISEMAKDLSSRSGSEVISFRTSNVVFMLISQRHHLSYFQHRSDVVSKTWSSKIEITHHYSR